MTRTILLILILSLLPAACGNGPSGQYTYHPPENINDGLEVGSLDEASIDPKPFEEAANKIQRGEYKEVHSVLVFKDGKLVFEEYFEGHKFKYEAENHHGELVNWDRTQLHRVMSVTKSITSVCIGIAVDHGIPNVDALGEHLLPRVGRLRRPVLPREARANQQVRTVVQHPVVHGEGNAEELPLVQTLVPGRRVVIVGSNEEALEKCDVGLLRSDLRCRRACALQVEKFALLVFELRQVALDEWGEIEECPAGAPLADTGPLHEWYPAVLATHRQTPVGRV